MFYTIKYALSARNCSIIVDLSRSGNRFVVVVWHKDEHRTIKRFETSDYSNAEKVFKEWCDAFDMTQVKEVEHDFD